MPTSVTQSKPSTDYCESCVMAHMYGKAIKVTIFYLGKSKMHLSWLGSSANNEGLKTLTLSNYAPDVATETKLQCHSANRILNYLTRISICATDQRT